MFLSFLTPRPLIALGLLLAYAVAATGLPLPVPQGKPATGERYPCEGCGCGCSTAEYCWTRCCCHTMKQRLAWAQRENVRPPDQALRLAQSKGLDVRRWLPSAPVVLQAATRTDAKPKCCCCRRPEKKPTSEEDSDNEISWRTFACGGALQLWLSISVALPREVDALRVEQASAPSLILPAASYSSDSASPPTPPPERWT